MEVLRWCNYMVVICNWLKFFSVQEKKASSHDSSSQGLIITHDACNMKCTCFATFGNFTNSTYFGKMLNTPPSNTIWRLSFQFVNELMFNFWKCIRMIRMVRMDLLHSRDTHMSLMYLSRLWGVWSAKH